MERYTAIERLCHGVVGVVFVARARQGVATFQANGILVFQQRLATGSADTRIKQVENAVKPVSESHGVIVLCGSISSFVAP